MRRNDLAAFAMYALPLIGGLGACSNLLPGKQAQVSQALAVACEVDGTVVPLAQPVLASAGRSGATIATVDNLIAHPAVVIACQRLGGAPAGVTPIPPPAPVEAEAPSHSG